MCQHCFYWGVVLSFRVAEQSENIVVDNFNPLNACWIGVQSVSPPSSNKVNTSFTLLCCCVQWTGYEERFVKMACCFANCILTAGISSLFRSLKISSILFLYPPAWLWRRQYPAENLHKYHNLKSIKTLSNSSRTHLHFYTKGKKMWLVVVGWQVWVDLCAYYGHTTYGSLRNFLLSSNHGKPLDLTKICPNWDIPKPGSNWSMAR